MAKVELSVQEKTMLLYENQSLWEQRLKLTDESHAAVVLLGPAGHIQWVTMGPFTDSLYLTLKQQIGALL